MENKLNREGIKNYSARFTEKVLADFFNSNNKISGNEILAVQPIRQINLFVIKNLFREWQKETIRMKSPFFDFDNEQVKEALSNFMNVLSRNISIEKDAFYELFKQATEETILLIFSPYDFYIHIVERNDKSIRLLDLQRIAKYVKINNNIITNLIEKMDLTNSDELNSENLLSLMDDVFASIQEGPEDIETYLNEFTKEVPLQVSDLYFDEEADRTTIEEENGPNIQEENNNQPTVEWTQESSKTLNDELSDSSKPTLAEVHAQKKVDSIKDSLSINQRFMFINILFDGNEEEFFNTLNRLEEAESFYAATDYVKENFSSWDFDSEEVQEFIEILEKRY